MGAHVSNNSWGGGDVLAGAPSTPSTARRQAGHIFVAAAGNNGTNNDTSPSIPPATNADNIISVAATDHNDQLASFSNYGATTVDLAAPGRRHPQHARRTTATHPTAARRWPRRTWLASSPSCASLHPDWTYQQVIVDQVPEHGRLSAGSGTALRHRRPIKRRPRRGSARLVAGRSSSPPIRRARPAGR